MKYLVVSDTHGRETALYYLLTENSSADALIHLGDGAEDASNVSGYVSQNIIMIKGNNDYYCDAPETRIIEIGGEKIFLTHGHRYSVRADRLLLAREAKRNGCSYALYGHTHIMSDETIEGVRCINPGSLGYPMGKCAALLIEDSPGFKISFINVTQ